MSRSRRGSHTVVATRRADGPAGPCDHAPQLVGIASKLASMSLGASTLNASGLTGPLASPLHPVKSYPFRGRAVRVTTEPGPYVAWFGDRVTYPPWAGSAAMV